MMTDKQNWMTDKQKLESDKLKLESDKLKAFFLAQLKKEEKYINTIACPSKAVMARSARIQELFIVLESK